MRVKRFPGRQCKLPGNTDLGRIHQRPVYPPYGGILDQAWRQRQTRRQDDEISSPPALFRVPACPPPSTGTTRSRSTLRIRDQQIRAGKLLQPPHVRLMSATTSRYSDERSPTRLSTINSGIRATVRCSLRRRNETSSNPSIDPATRPCPYCGVSTTSSTGN